VEALLASAEEDQAVDRWEQDMAGGPRRRGSPAAEEVEGRGRDGREGNGFGWIGFGWRVSTVGYSSRGEWWRGSDGEMARIMWLRRAG
jgi:hypothetical protein